ncbi:MAG: hypothetical protein ACXWDI_12465 [Nocardioides sp.]
MVAPVEQQEVDVLGRDGRPPLLAPWVRRLLVAVLMIAVVAAWLVDREVRSRELVAVERCAAATTTAVEGAHGRLGFIAGYVRPALAASPPVELRGELYAMVSSAAADHEGKLLAALDTCRSTSVLALHDDLRDRRASCERRLRSTLDHLAAVARDGRAAFGPSPDRSPPAGRSGPDCTG